MVLTSTHASRAPSLRLSQSKTLTRGPNSSASLLGARARAIENAHLVDARLEEAVDDRARGAAGTQHAHRSVIALSSPALV